MKKIIYIALSFMLLALSQAEAQQKYLGAGDSILTFVNAGIDPAPNIVIMVSDSAITAVDTVIIEVKNNLTGLWVTVGSRCLLDNAAVASMIPGNGLKKYYSPYWFYVNSGELRVRRTNVTSRTQKTRVTIGRKDHF